VLLAVTTGLRRSELLGLKWEDVDLERGTLRLRRTLQQTDAGLEFSTEMKTPKSRRQIHLPEMTLKALRRHKAEQAAYRLRVGPEKYQDHGLICARRNGNPFKPDSFTEMFRRLVREAGVTRVTFHDLRRTHVSHRIKNRKSIESAVLRRSLPSFNPRFRAWKRRSAGGK
jgi:integrase